MAQQIWLIRHGETEWSRSGRHTGKTDVPLTERGREQAIALGPLVQAKTFALVLTSPSQRARQTCRLAGFTDAEIDPRLMEWDYGDYEGRTTAEIRKERPAWSLWRDGVPHGERIEDAGLRAKAVIERAAGAEGDVMIFAHGHILRILTACWLGLAPEGGRLFALDPASVCVLGYEHETRVILSWNLRGK